MLTHAECIARRSPKRVVVIGAGGFVGRRILQRTGSATASRRLALTRKEVDLLAPDGADALQGACSQPDDAVVFVSAVAPAKNAAQLMTTCAWRRPRARRSRPRRPRISSTSAPTRSTPTTPIRSPRRPPSRRPPLHGMMHAARELMFRSDYRGPVRGAAADPDLRRARSAQRLRAEPLPPPGREGRADHASSARARSSATTSRSRTSRVSRGCILFHRSSGALNAVTGVSTSFHDIADIVAAQFTPRAQVKSVPRPGPRPHLLHRFFDITDCYTAFPDFHFEPLAEGLARVHARSHKDGGARG